MKKLIYVIDDHPDTVELISLWLEAKGMDVVGFHRFEPALKMLGFEIHPNFVLMDYHLHNGGMTAKNFITSARVLAPNLPIVVVSGDHKIQEELEWQSVYFLMKPFDLDDLSKFGLPIV